MYAVTNEFMLNGQVNVLSIHSARDGNMLMLNGQMPVLSIHIATESNKFKLIGQMLVLSICLHYTTCFTAAKQTKDVDSILLLF